MNKHVTLFAVLCLIIQTILITSSATPTYANSANLFLNPSFETGDFSNWTQRLSTIIFNSSEAYDGNFYVNLTKYAAGNTASVFQNLTVQIPCIAIVSAKIHTKTTLGYRIPSDFVDVTWLFSDGSNTTLFCGAGLNASWTENEVGQQLREESPYNTKTAIGILIQNGNGVSTLPIYLDGLNMTATGYSLPLPTNRTNAPINLLDIPARLGLVLNISPLIAGLIISCFMLLCMVAVVAIFTDNLFTMATFLIIGMSICILLGWLPYFILIFVIIIAALMLADKASHLITGSGSGVEK